MVFPNAHTIIDFSPRNLWDPWR